MKKFFKKIGEWFIKIFAAVMKVVAPKLCVKCFTKRGRERQTRYFNEWVNNKWAKKFVPSTQAQLKAIEHLNLSDDDIRAREWSHDAMKSMFEKGIFALIDRLKGSDAELLDLVVRSNDVETIAAAFEKATPTKVYLIGFLGMDCHDTIRKVFLKVPNAFMQLEYSDIPPHLREKTIKRLFDSDYAYTTKVLIMWAQKVFAALFGKENKPPIDANVYDAAVNRVILPILKANDLESDSAKIVREEWTEKIFSTLIEKNNADMTYYESHLFKEAVYAIARIDGKNSRFWTAENFWLLKGRHTDEYEYLKLHYGSYFLRIALPEAKKTLAGDATRFDLKEAKKWLNIALENSNYPEAQEVILDSLVNELKAENPSEEKYSALQQSLSQNVQEWKPVIKALLTLPKRFSAGLEKKLVAAVDDFSRVEMCLKMLDSEYYHVKLREKMVGYTTSENAKKLLEYFPFVDWGNELATKAALKLVAVGRFPMSRIAELGEEARRAVEEKLEIKSQIACLNLNRKYYNDVNVMLQRKLHQKAEIYLLTDCVGFYMKYHGDEDIDPYVNHYLQHNTLDEQSFREWVSITQDSFGTNIKEYVGLTIRLYAEKQGLTWQNYLDLMYGPYASLAPILKEYVKGKGMDGVTEEAGGVSDVSVGEAAVG